MLLFIQVENGTPKEHPITLENLAHAVPNFDPSRPPSWLAPFERVEAPTAPSYMIVEHAGYTMCEDGVVRDSWSITEQPEP